jgi:TonB family protein
MAGSVGQISVKHRRILKLGVFLALVMATVAVRAGQDQVVARLGEARELYSSAEYDRALAALEGIDSTTVAPDQARDRALYQALCLLALNRKPEAESRIEEVVLAMPLFRPDGDMPPRLRALVDEVRGRMRPALVQQHYRSGKDLFDVGNYADALREFTLVLQLAEDGSNTAQASVLADITTLAAGFRDLSRARSSASPGPVPVSGSKPDGDGDSTIVPPVTIRQNMPAWPEALRSRAEQHPGVFSGALDIVVGQSGDVKAVTLVKSVHPLYDALLLSAAKQWRYKPATRAGNPVEFVKRIAVNVTGK